MGSKIRIATSEPSLKGKIQIDLRPDDTDVFWYIRFNIPLDETSVSPKTMDVTDTMGYIMRTDITYSREKNMIVISPIDSYEQDIFYLLNISTKVRSEKGQNLKSKIHILFKLYENKISDFKVLKSNVQVPKTKPRPKDYEDKITKAKLLAIGNEIAGNVPQSKLPYMDMHINIIPAVIGVLLLCAYIYFRIMALLIVSGIVCVIGAAIIIFQASRINQRSAIAYNRGVYAFNKESYEKAEAAFKLASSLDRSNEMAQYALKKVSYYLSP